MATTSADRFPRRDATAPWDIWSHFSAIETTGFKSLVPGERVEVDFFRADEESFRYLAKRVRRLDVSENPSP